MGFERSTLRGVVDRKSESIDAEARVDERGDLVERIARGDALALVELLEYASGAKARSVGVISPRAD